MASSTPSFISLSASLAMKLSFVSSLVKMTWLTESTMYYITSSSVPISSRIAARTSPSWKGFAALSLALPLTSSDTFVSWFFLREFAMLILGIGCFAVAWICAYSIRWTVAKNYNRRSDNFKESRSSPFWITQVCTVMWCSFNDNKIFLFWIFVSCQFLYTLLFFMS